MLREQPTDSEINADLRSLEENLWVLWSRFGRGEGCHLFEDAEATWFDTPIPTLPYNAVIRSNAAPETADRKIDEIVDHYRGRNVPFLWFLHPSSRPLDIAERLRARGMEEAKACPTMSMDLAELPEPDDAPEGIEIVEVTRDEDVYGFLELVSWRWNVPSQAADLLPGVIQTQTLGRDVRCWIARRGGVPVSKVVLHLAAGVAGIYGVVTRPEARGFGLARTLTLEALRHAREAGFGRAVLESTPMARSLYEKIGFRANGTFRIFAPPNSLHI